MIVRNVESRIIKLEARRARPDEILVVWRQPGDDPCGAITSAQFASGDKVICPEWFGADKPPLPKWHRDRLSSSMTEEEYDYLSRTIERVAEAGGRADDGQIPRSNLSKSVKEMTDNELIYALLGVQT
jgi:hypothetical protein